MAILFVCSFIWRFSYLYYIFFYLLSLWHFFLFTYESGLTCGAFILMCVPSIATITLGKTLIEANHVITSFALSPFDHTIKIEANFTIAFVTLVLQLLTQWFFLKLFANRSVTNKNIKRKNTWYNSQIIKDNVVKVLMTHWMNLM